MRVPHSSLSPPCITRTTPAASCGYRWAPTTRDTPDGFRRAKGPGRSCSPADDILPGCHSWLHGSRTGWAVHSVRRQAARGAHGPPFIGFVQVLVMKPAGMWRNLLSPVLALAGFLLVWEIAVRVLDISLFLLPPPSRVFMEIHIHAATLMRHAGATLSVVLAGFAISTCVGIPVALAVSFSPMFRRTVYPLIVFSQLIPKIALAPL